ncbi:hypothetical protein [Streptomyces cacaoi]|uniref:Uncharacterized protein n=1 Tax=Streptomyces cacaoi TaxID=1898 RepID=A0A4Y3R3R4_STRCI|nr:hypothetical protein [Streptomyces cacaoi]NNG84591.1 hypothetical protein [Streptomyces cacaoi]GEB51949.1 hypothetical protein SCA03_45000 [Streptomyces cacaoi]
MTTQPPHSTQVYYCECYVNEHRLGIYDAHSPREALRWVRISLMMIAITLDEETYKQARSWLDHGQQAAGHDLEAGKPHTLTLKQRTTAATWTISPIA